MSKLTGSDLIIKCLKMYDVDTIFGIAGDHILHLLDRLIDQNFRMIDGRHEAASVHMANAYSRILRKPGVVLSTTPGHANAVAGLANAMHSEAPVINIAGSADSGNIGRGAMQEFDQVGIAKPVTKGIDNGKVHFRHHEVVGARMTKEILSKLKYPKKLISSVALLVENHLRPHTYKMGWTDSAVRRYIIDAGDVLDELNELVRCDVTTKNNEKAETIYKYLDDLEKRIKEVKEKEELKKLRPPVDGNEIMKILKIEPGPSLGKIMESLYEQRINEGEVSKEEAIKLAKEVYKKL